MFGLSFTKLLIIGIAIFALYKLFKNEKGRRGKDDLKLKERKIAAGEMVKDSVCGAYVDIDSSVKVRDGKKVHHFCSFECRQQYLDALEGDGREVPQLEKKDEE